ncbi:MAG: bifunctional sulfate adenylyltransferase/adenylylsulfate kinase [Gammaproteobacteria bacterium]|nr:bifunctional sulfate adenylyltransferase/adenylylsulfate kinase [Gammaproteobacteria bacterium]MBU1979491.1 bifunctional sulfate adenylyltransferase/adenylylsulfate kinase [Gammaproteobacteria bacterium]
MDHLIKPYGGNLISLLAGEERVAQLKLESQDLMSVVLSQRQLCDLELLINGAFSPLSGFMTQEVYDGVVADMRLPDGTLWPIPINFDVSASIAEKLKPGMRLALHDEEGFMLAVLLVESIWQPDKKREAELVYGTVSMVHPGVSYLFEQVGEVYVGGTLEGVQLPAHYDFETLRDTPEELRLLFNKHGWNRVVAFHISKPMHRLHLEITLNAAREAQANILLHPAVGMTKPGDLNYYARVHCYKAILKHYPYSIAMLSLFPMAMRMAGPREAILNAIIRQNYGCSHFMVGLKHAEPPVLDEEGKRFYPPESAQKLLERYQEEMEIRLVKIPEYAYVPDEHRYMPVDEISRGNKQTTDFGQRELVDCLARGLRAPSWYSFPEVINALIKASPPRSKQGITLFFTGLSGAGKSTLAKIIFAKFIESGGRPVTLLDGDVVRHNLSSELGFSKAHRDLNVRRIGFVASEITKNGGVAICAPIAPYMSTRRSVRNMIKQHGAFIEIHVETSLEVCESRDRKGLYAKARQGLIPEFTGISDPYEVPENPELRINTAELSPIQAAQQIFLYLLSEGYLGASVSEEFDV